MGRKVRVAGVPGDFNVPPGWPTPTDRWVRTNAFWVPPAGWTPAPGLRPAPDNWRYWNANPLWNRSKGHIYAHLRIWSRLASAALAGSIISRVAAIRAELPVLTLVAVVLFAGAVGCYSAFLIGYARTTRRALAEFAALAADSRQRRLTREYQRYLLDAA